MKVSLLNERITIEKSKIEVDKIGNHKNVWSKYYSCYATISSESPQEETSSGAIWDESKIDFTIRYSREVSDISSMGFRVIFHNYFHSFRFAQGTKRYENVSLSLFFIYNSFCRELGILQITGR